MFIRVKHLNKKKWIKIEKDVIDFQTINKTGKYLEVLSFDFTNY